MEKKEKPFQLVGYPTPVAAVYKNESHKLHQAFPVEEEKTIIAGMPVALNNDGTISPYTGAADEIYLGIAVTQSIKPAYPTLPQAPEVTVMMEGFAIVYGVSNGVIKPGYVQVVDGTTDDSGFVKYKQSITGTGDTAKAAPTNFIAINATENTGDLLQILVK